LIRSLSIDFYAVATAVFAFFIVPLLPLLALGNAAVSHLEVLPTGILDNPFFYVELWFITFAPILAGHLAAKRCHQRPLLHGVLAGCLGAFLVVSWFLCFGSRVSVLFALLDISLAGLGGWVWRIRARRPAYIRVT
jgi:hypothetical protein